MPRRYDAASIVYATRRQQRFRRRYFSLDAAYFTRHARHKDARMMLLLCRRHVSMLLILPATCYDAAYATLMPLRC